MGQEDDYQITFLAKDFESFINGLVNDSTYVSYKPMVKPIIEEIKISDGFFKRFK